jgi:hypothetical protein
MTEHHFEVGIDCVWPRNMKLDPLGLWEYDLKGLTQRRSLLVPPPPPASVAPHFLTLRIVEDRKGYHPSALHTKFVPLTALAEVDICP